MNNSHPTRLIAFYLPQFHPIPENDCAWGMGFTDWTNVTKSKPLFRGHYQPQLPSELGFYDLRVPETREAQAALAREYGIEAFCYWHYWFAGERLLERPFKEVCESGRPDFPFCLGWANETWSGLWSGGDKSKIIRKQTYPGRSDHQHHFECLMEAFRDSRYVRVNGKPLILIYRPLKIPDCRAMLDYWRELARHAGLPGLYAVATLEYNGERTWDAKANGFDAITVWTLPRLLIEGRPCLWSSRLKSSLRNRKRTQAIVRRLLPGVEKVYDYNEILPLLACAEKFDLPFHPMAIPNWDTTARYGNSAIVLHNSTPDFFRTHLREVIKQVVDQPPEQRIVFVKSWNEWAEGNYIEPDQRFGHGYLQVLKQELASVSDQHLWSGVAKVQN